MNRFSGIRRALPFSFVALLLMVVALSSTFTALAVPMPVNVTFQVTVPAFTQVDTAVQIVGNRGILGEGSDPLTEWGAGVNLTQISSTLWEVTLNFNEGDELEFYFLRDSDSDRVEMQADGYTALASRTYTVPATGGEPVVLPLSVANWKDVLLVSVSPVDGATNVPVSSNVVATFNKTVASGSTFTVEDSANAAVAGAFTVSGTTVTFDPTADLAYNDTFDVTIDGGIVADGVGTREFSDLTDFSTPAAPDVPVTFNVSVPWYELSVPNVYVSGDSAQLGSNDPDFLQLTGDPFSGYSATVFLQEGSTITYFYSRGTEATRETGVDNATFATRTITVSSGLVVNDTVQFWEDPLVTYNIPVNGTLLHPVDQPLAVTFSKNVNFDQNLVVMDSSNMPVAGVSSYNASTFTYTFTPAADLAYDSTYTFSANNFVATDSAVQQYPFSASFKTAPAEIAVTFTVNVPDYTPVGSVIYFTFEYMIGDVNGVMVVSGSEAMTPTGTPNQYSYTLNVLETVDVSYTIDRGSANTVETESDGETSVSRTITVDDSGDGTQSVVNTVANWRDPIVVSHSPAANATQQPVSSDITIVFSKPIGFGTFSVVDSDSNAVAGSVGLVGGSNSFTFSPDAPGFRHADTITVTVSGFPGFVTGTQEGTYTFSFETDALELLGNIGFEDDPVTFKPTPWKLTNSKGEKVKCNDVVPRFAIAHEGNCAFMFRSSPLENSRLTQVLDDELADVPFAVGDELLLSGWFSTPKDGNMFLQLRVYFSDGSFITETATITGQLPYHKVSLPAVVLNRTDISKIRVRVRNLTLGSFRRSWVDLVSLKLRQGDVTVRGLPAAGAPLSLPDSFRGGN